MDTTEISIPQSVEPTYLLNQASEVENLCMELNQAEIEWENAFFRIFEETPGGLDYQSRLIKTEIQCREQHVDLFNTYESLKTRLKGMTLKASLVQSALRSYAVVHDSIDAGHPIHSLASES